MFRIDEKKTPQIFIRPGVTDMRKAINGLSMIVQEEIRHDPFSGNYYAFCSRSRRLIKILYWDRNGFCLWHKRLEEDKFPWPKNAAAVQELSAEQLSWLLHGLDFRKAYSEKKYSSAG
jgi:transposase